MSSFYENYIEKLRTLNIKNENYNIIKLKILMSPCDVIIIEQLKR